MKSTNRILFTLLAIGLTVSMVACGQTKSAKTEHGDHEHHEMAEAKMEKPETELSKEQTGKILTAYLSIKDALVKTDGEAASSSAGQLLTLLGGNKSELVEKIKFDAEHIQETKEASHQRDHFNTLSDNVYALVKSTSANETPLYRQYCPMAMNNTGAYWLSSEKEVLNPYFGDKMLRCGSVKETLAVQ